jgi:peptidoglycan biosynthesis protein MviN/MurJ (putative lipid II flippase)
LCAATQTALLLYILRGKIGALGGRQIARSIMRIALATLAMGVVVLIALKAARDMVPGTGAPARIIQLLLPVSCGLISYLVFCHVLRVREVREVLSALARREKR